MNYRYMDDPYGPIDLSKGPIGIKYRTSYFIKTLLGYVGYFLILLVILRCFSSILPDVAIVVLAAIFAVVVFYAIYRKLRIAKSGAPALVLGQDGFTATDLPTLVRWHDVQSVEHQSGFKRPGELRIEFLPGPDRLIVENRSLACSFDELIKIFRSCSDPARSAQISK